MNLRLLAAATLFSAITFTACKKNSNNDNTATDQQTELSTHTDDQAMVSSESDNVANDANTVAEGTTAFGKGEGVQALICDATIAIDTTGNLRKVTITYNGTICNPNRKRTGVVVLSMPIGMHWYNAGAALTVSFQNFKITRISDNKSITINGTQVHTNVSGGKLINLATLGTIIHTITSSGMSITFDDGTQRTWQVAKKRTFTYSNGVVITETGTHTEGNVTTISEWGTNREGHNFTTAITQPLVVRQDCDFRVTAGQVTHNVSTGASAVATFGLDSNGNPTACPGTGHYYFKVVITAANGTVITLIHPY